VGQTDGDPPPRIGNARQPGQTGGTPADRVDRRPQGGQTNAGTTLTCQVDPPLGPHPTRCRCPRRDGKRLRCHRPALHLQDGAANDPHRTRGRFHGHVEVPERHVAEPNNRVETSSTVGLATGGGHPQRDGRSVGLAERSILHAPQAIEPINPEARHGSGARFEDILVKRLTRWPPSGFLIWFHPGRSVLDTPAKGQPCLHPPST